MLDGEALRQVGKLIADCDRAHGCSTPSPRNTSTRSRGRLR